MAEETARERRGRIRRQEDERRARKDAEHAAWLAGHPDRAPLLALNLASELVIAEDEWPAIAVHTNEEAVEILLASDWLAAHDAQVRAEAWDEGHKVGWEHCQDGNYGTDHWDDETPNPYRAEATR